MLAGLRAGEVLAWLEVLEYACRSCDAQVWASYEAMERAAGFPQNAERVYDRSEDALSELQTAAAAPSIDNLEVCV